MPWYFGDTYWLTYSTFGGSLKNYPDKDNLGWLFCVRHSHRHRLLHLSHHWLNIRPPVWTQSFFDWTCTFPCWSLLRSGQFFDQWSSLSQWKEYDSPFLLCFCFSLWSCLYCADRMPIRILRFPWVVSCILQDCSEYDNHSYNLELPQMSWGVHPCLWGINCGNLSSWPHILHFRPH